MNRPMAIISDSEGNPQPIKIQVRESETSPGRLKVHFTVSTTAGLMAQGVGAVDGNQVFEVPEDAPDDVPVCPEFRIELN